MINLEKVKIESGIKPPPNNKGGRYSVVVHNMKRGDSVLLPIKEARSLAVAINNAGYRAQTARQMGTELFRVWKLERKAVGKPPRFRK